MLDFIRIACAVPAVKVGDVKKNVQGICAYMEKADAQNVDVLLFPELSITELTEEDVFAPPTEEDRAAVAEYLEAHPKITWVNYPGLPDNPEYARAQKYFRNGMASGVLCFGVKGGAKAGEKVMNSLKLANIVVHVADVRTGVLHPASMTHRQLTEQELIDAGVSPDLIRVSVGIENIEDIKADFDQALAAAADLR